MGDSADQAFTLGIRVFKVILPAGHGSFSRIAFLASAGILPCQNSPWKYSSLLAFNSSVRSVHLGDWKVFNVDSRLAALIFGSSCMDARKV